MKRTLFSLMTLAIMALEAGCSKGDSPSETKSICEIGNTGKVVSSVFKSSYRDGSQIRMDDNATIWYCPDCSKINALDHSEEIRGIPGGAIPMCFTEIPL